MSLFLEKAAAIGFANFIQEVSYNHRRVSYGSNSKGEDDQFSKILLSMSKNILKYDDLFTEAYKMQLLSLGQILNLSEISEKISKSDLSKISIIKEKMSDVGVSFSESDINTAKKGDLIIDSVRSMTEEEMDIIYLLGLDKSIRWDLMSKRLIKNNMYYLESNYFGYERGRVVNFIFKMWANNYKEDFMSFIKSEDPSFSFKAFKYTIRERLAFAIGSINKDMKIARKMRSEAMGVSLCYAKGLFDSKSNFSKEELSSIISNFSDTKYYDVAVYIAENFEIDETTSMLANENCSHILRKKYAERG